MTADIDSAPLYGTLHKDYQDADDFTLSENPSGSFDVSFTNLSHGERVYLVNTFTSNRERHRRLHQLDVADQERRERKIARLRALFLQGSVWAAEGGTINIKDMTPNHALNSYNLITKEWRRYAGAGISFEDLFNGYGSPHATPLGQALLKRSQKRETRRHKRMDTESRERYKDRLEKARAVAGAIWTER